jgi:hypothetical protein
MTATDSTKEIYNKYTDLPLFSYNCIKYLMDNNELIWKLLNYTDKNAYKNDSTHPNLTKAQKGALIYDGSPDETGYRVFLDVGQDDAISTAICIMRVSPVEIVPTNHIVGNVVMAFEILCHNSINTLSNYSTRVVSITQQLLEVLNGAYVSGLGRLYFDRKASAKCRVTASGQIPFKGSVLVFCNWIN